MTVPTLITDLSTTASSNAPAGSDSPSTLDDIQRAHAAFIAQLRDRDSAFALTLLDDATASDMLTTLGVSTFAKTILDDTTAAAARSTLGAAESGSNSDITSLTGLTTAISGAYLGNKIQPITASVATNALTLTLNPTTLDFRSSTLTSGTVNTRQVAAAISMTISSGSTLGTVNGIQSDIAVLAIDNAGTVELAAVNIAGGTNLDETTLLSTTAEGGAGAADSSTVAYSTTARTNVPFRVVGIVRSTQATAGTWATAPSLIQGAGGQAVTSMQSLGYGQTWQDVTGSRALSTTYYNTTGKPIYVSVAMTLTGGSVSGSLSVNGVIVSGSAVAVNQSCWFGGIVPPGISYGATANTGTLVSWSELR